MSDSSGDLQNTATTDIRQVLAEMQKITNGYKAMGVEIRKVNAFGKDLQKTLSDSKGSKAVGQAGSLIGTVGGGGAGSSFKSIFGGDTDNVYGKLAVTAGLAAAALKAFDIKIARIGAQAHASATAINALTKGMEAADNVTKGRAKQGLGESDQRRALLATGGAEAVAAADAIARSGMANPDDAMRGVGSIYARRGNNPRLAQQNVDIAHRAAAAGVPFAAAAEQAGDIGGEIDPDQRDMAVNRIFRSHFNRLGPVTSTAGSANALANDPVEQAVRESNRQAQLTRDADRAKAARFGGTVAAEESAEARNPVAAAQLEAYRLNTVRVMELQQELKQLNQQFQKLGKVAQSVDVITAPVRDTSLTAQMVSILLEIERTQNAFLDAAIKGPTRGSVYRPKEY